MLLYFLAAAKRTKNLFGQMNKHLSRRVLFISVEYATEINAPRGCGKEMEWGYAMHTDQIGEENGMTGRQIKRYIRLTELIPELNSDCQWKISGCSGKE